MRLFRSAALCAAVILAPLLSSCDGFSDGVAQDEAADQAYTFTIPLYKFFATQRASITQGFVPNMFFHARTLATSDMRTVTKPNHDTLYSSGYLKLDNGPLEIDIPATGSRYFSVAFMDAYTNNFAVRGTRVDGGEAKRFWLAGPGWSGTPPEGTILLRSQTNAVWALGRTYVDGTEADYPVANALQDQIRIILPAGTSPATWSATDLLTPPLETDYPNYFSYVDKLLTAEPPDADGLAYLDAGPVFIGVGVGLVFNPALVDPTNLTYGATNARTRALTRTGAVTPSGWSYATEEIGAYGTNYELRAQLALSGWAPCRRRRPSTSSPTARSPRPPRR